ncbi:hypothetical protein ACHAPI_012231 [Fusarium lateritium]
MKRLPRSEKQNSADNFRFHPGKVLFQDPNKCFLAVKTIVKYASPIVYSHDEFPKQIMLNSLPEYSRTKENSAIVEIGLEIPENAYFVPRRPWEAMK